GSRAIRNLRRPNLHLADLQAHDTFSPGDRRGILYAVLKAKENTHGANFIGRGKSAGRRCPARVHDATTRGIAGTLRTGDRANRQQTFGSSVEANRREPGLAPLGSLQLSGSA